MKDNEIEEGEGMISAAMIGLILAGALFFTTLMAFLTVNTPPTTVTKRGPSPTTGVAPSTR
jgi:hypothetical protein